MHARRGGGGGGGAGPLVQFGPAMWVHRSPKPHLWFLLEFYRPPRASPSRRTLSLTSIRSTHMLDRGTFEHFSGRQPFLTIVARTDCCALLLVGHAVGLDVPGAAEVAVVVAAADTPKPVAI